MPRLDETFVRGLTISELKNLLEKRYAEFLIDPDIKVRIAVFKSIRVLVRGEVRNPGFYKFPAYDSSVSFKNDDKRNNSEIDLMKQNNFLSLIALFLSIPLAREARTFFVGGRERE